MISDFLLPLPHSCEVCNSSVIASFLCAVLLALSRVRPASDCMRSDTALLRIPSTIVAYHLVFKCNVQFRNRKFSLVCIGL